MNLCEKKKKEKKEKKKSEGSECVKHVLQRVIKPKQAQKKNPYEKGPAILAGWFGLTLFRSKNKCPYPYLCF